MSKATIPIGRHWAEITAMGDGHRVFINLVTGQTLPSDKDIDSPAFAREHSPLVDVTWRPPLPSEIEEGK